MILPGYIFCLKRAGSTLHKVAQTGRYDTINLPYMLFRLGLLEWGLNSNSDQKCLRYRRFSRLKSVQGSNLMNLGRVSNPPKTGGISGIKI